MRFLAVVAHLFSLQKVAAFVMRSRKVLVVLRVASANLSFKQQTKADATGLHFTATRYLKSSSFILISYTNVLFKKIHMI